MSDWPSNLETCSFRNVSFHFEEASGLHGRRLARHEYPGRDEPHIEDMGRKTREISLTAYVLDPDLFAKAAALIDACEAEGPGTLAHPTRGRLTVVCETCRPRWSVREGRMCRLDLSFVEASAARYPAARSDTTAAVESESLTSLAAVRSDFADTFSVDGRPGWVADDLSATVAATATGLGAVWPAVDPSPLIADAPDLVRAPSELAQRVADLMPAPSSGDWRGCLGAMGAVPDPGIPLTTATRRAQAGALGALSGLVDGTAVISAARSAARAVFESSADALSARDVLASALDGLMQAAADPVYRALGALRAAAIRDLTAKAPRLPYLLFVTPRITRPPLAVANDLFGDVPSAVLAGAEGIVGRNRLRHPGFAAGGETLEVLSRVAD